MTDVLPPAYHGDLDPGEESPYHQDENGASPPEPIFRLTVQTAKSLCDEEDSSTGRLLGPLILQGGRTIIVGATGDGKTTLCLQLVRAVVCQETFLDWTGDTADARALVIDLEQGRRSVKRSLRDAGLGERDDVDLVLVPDGLAIDENGYHYAELERVIAEGNYALVVLDPYYKAHRADDPNAERPIIDLMRRLDGLRDRYGFALVLPAHPRKQAPGAPTVRKLTVDDISGSGAVSRGAEVVLGIERVSHGYARLRFLKDREGELQVGTAYGLIYAQDHGYRRDPKDLEPDRDYRSELLDLASDGEWRTLKEWREALRAGVAPVKNALGALVAEGALEYMVGPSGRHKDARCYRLAGSEPPSLLDPDSDIPW